MNLGKWSPTQTDVFLCGVPSWLGDLGRKEETETWCADALPVLSGRLSLPQVKGKSRDLGRRCTAGAVRKAVAAPGVRKKSRPGAQMHCRCCQEGCRCPRCQEKVETWCADVPPVLSARLSLRQVSGGSGDLGRKK